MPVKSDKQRRAMYAALHGKSTLGIPKSVAEKFVGEGHDVLVTEDMSSVDWRGLMRGLFRWIMEEKQEDEHAADAQVRDAAGVAFVDPTGQALFVKRHHPDDHDGEWAFPGGWLEEGETPEAAALREAREEVGEGIVLDADLAPLARITSPEGTRYTTFYQPVPGPFGTQLSEESYEARWAPLDDPPQPLHPGVGTLFGVLGGEGEGGADDAPVIAKTGLHDKIHLALKQPLLSYTTRQLDVDPSPKVPEKRTGGEGVAGDALDPLLKEARVAELHGRRDLARRADAKVTALFAQDEEIEQAVKGKASDPEALAAWVRRRQVGPVRKAAAGRDAETRHDPNSGQFASNAGGTSTYHHQSSNPASSGFKKSKFEAHAHAEHLKGLGHEGVKVTLKRQSYTVPGKGVSSSEERTVHHGQPPKAKDNQPALATAPNAGIPLIVVRALRGGKPTRIKFAKSVIARDKKMGMDWAGCAELITKFDTGVLAFDRDSVRVKDEDGRLHVASSHISKANVCPYWGEEIPNWQKHGLVADKKYMLLRDPDELKKAASTFNNLPILSKHVPSTADSHPEDQVIGSTGTDATFDGTYLDNSLVFWPKSAISDIEDDVRKELSSGYYYDYDPTPGTYQGVRYDGVMRNIRGNHVALVPEGRAGRDVVVGDSQIEEKTMTVKLSPRAVVARGALMMYLRPRLAADAQIDFGPILADVTAKNFAKKRGGIAVALKKATDGKLAADADIDDVDEVLDAVEEFKDDVVDKAEELKADILDEAGPDDDMNGDPDDDMNQDSPEMLAKVLEFLKGKLSPEDMNALTEMIGGEEQITESPEDKAAREGMDETEEERMAREKKDEESGAKDTALIIRRARSGLVTQSAMDEAIKREVDKTRAEMAEQARQVQEATRAVRPYVGELAMDAALDTADKIYAQALTLLGVPGVEKIHPSAYPALLASQRRPGADPAPRLATDTLPAGTKTFAERYPGAANIGTI